MDITDVGVNDELKLLAYKVTYMRDQFGIALKIH